MTRLIGLTFALSAFLNGLAWLVSHLNGSDFTHSVALMALCAACVAIVMRR